MMENRKFDTLKITTGAMILAIFAVLLLLNRQTAGLFEEIFIYLLPIPMVAYAAKYDLRASLSVFFGMVVFPFFFGTFTTIFYAISAALLGLVFGTCLRKKADLTFTMLLLMGLSALFNVLSTVTLASLFGYDLDQEIREMQDMMRQMLSSFGPAADAYQSFLNSDFLMRMLIISMVLLGIVQGFVIFHLSLILLRRLRIPVPTAKSVYAYYPPRITGLIAMLAYILGSGSMTGQTYAGIPAEILQTVWICGYSYLIVFGIIAAALFIRTRITQKRLLTPLLTMLVFLFFSPVLLFAGFAYVSLGLHEWMLGGHIKNRG